jgi:hypothetical protein
VPSIQTPAAKKKMSVSIQEILAPLNPHWDRIIRQPMSAGEVDGPQRQVGASMPEPLRDYLRQGGTGAQKDDNHE